MLIINSRLREHHIGLSRDNILRMSNRGGDRLMAQWVIHWNRDPRRQRSRGEMMNRWLNRWPCCQIYILTIISISTIFQAIHSFKIIIVKQKNNKKMGETRDRICHSDALSHTLDLLEILIKGILPIAEDYEDHLSSEYSLNWEGERHSMVIEPSSMTKGDYLDS